MSAASASSGARSSRTDYTVLACLSLRPMSGYDIKKLLDDSIGHFWSESYGQIYPSLRRLQRDGLVVESAAGQRGRREYTLTPEGLAELRRWLEQPAQPDVLRYETSLKLFFGSQMDAAAARAHVERYRERQRARLAEYRAQQQRLPVGLSHSPQLPFFEVVLDGGVRYAAMAIEWCDATLRRLDRLDASDYPAGPGAIATGDAVER